MRMTTESPPQFVDNVTKRVTFLIRVSKMRGTPSKDSCHRGSRHVGRVHFYYLLLSCVENQTPSQGEKTITHVVRKKILSLQPLLTFNFQPWLVLKKTLCSALILTSQATILLMPHKQTSWYVGSTIKPSTGEI